MLLNVLGVVLGLVRMLWWEMPELCLVTARLFHSGRLQHTSDIKKGELLLVVEDWS